MMLCSGDFRVALVTEHIPVREVAQYITRETILSKLNIIHQSLVKDFNIEKPKIAVLGLNPHAGDEGLIGREEEDIIKPAIKEAKHSMIVTGPYSADAFLPGVITSVLTPCWPCIMTRVLSRLKHWLLEKE